MKKILTLILVVIVFTATITGCGTSNMAADTATEALTEATEISTEVSAVETAEITVDKWDVVSIDNYIPITPEGYSGTLVSYTDEYTGKDGVTVEKVYERVAFVDIDDSTDYGESRTHWASVEIDGEIVYGKYLLKRETLYFLEHTTGSNQERFYLDIDIPDDTYYVYMLERNEDTVLLEAGSTIFSYSFNTGNCSVITDSALDFKYPVGDTLYFTDWNHEEYKCDWKENIELISTGKKISYWSDNFKMEINSDFQEEFAVMQDAIKKGTDEDVYSGKYDIYYNGNIYRVSDDEYMGNIHLPYPIKWNRNLIYTEVDSCWLVETNSLTLYRYGDVVCRYDLPAGTWRVIENIITANNTNNILMLNVSEHSIYKINNEGLTKVLSDVQDYCEAYGELYWMDSQFNAYELSWIETTESILIGTDVVGISKYTDERAGFVVKPNDDRCNVTSDGFSLCTLYGDDWLNQEKSSGAWALEYDWTTE